MKEVDKIAFIEIKPKEKRSTISQAEKENLEKRTSKLWLEKL